MKVAIVGGGIIGLCSAYFLAKEGCEVTVFDQSKMDEGCSYGNAGMIVPSHVMPLAQPGMVAQGIKWMFDSKSPFYIKPRFSKSLASWGLTFLKHANQHHVNQAMPALRDLSILSKELYQEFAKQNNSFLYEEKGLLMLYKHEKTGEEVIHEAKMAEQLGLSVNYLNASEINALETGATTNAIGAVHYTGDAHLYPQKFMSFLKEELKHLKVKIQSETRIEDFVVDGYKVHQLKTNKGDFFCDAVILSGGSWNPEIAKQLQLKIAILPGKGYSFTLNDFKKGPVIPSILCEGKVAVTPMGNDLRFGGTLEITHTQDTKINMKRVSGIVETIHDFYPELQFDAPKKEELWYGFRPCTPTGMPIIKRSEKIPNLIIAGGHAMMGLSLAPATGKIVSELLFNKQTSINTTLFK